MSAFRSADMVGNALLPITRLSCGKDCRICISYSGLFRVQRMKSIATTFLHRGVALAAWLALANAVEGAETPSRELIEVSSSLLKTADFTNARGEIHETDGERWLRIESTGVGDAEVALGAPAHGWDLSDRDAISFTLRNASTVQLTVRVRAENPGASGSADNCRAAVAIQPSEVRKLILRLTRRPEDPGYDRFKSFYMYFLSIHVRDNTVDPAHIAKLVVSIDRPRTGQMVDVSNICAVG